MGVLSTLGSAAKAVAANENVGKAAAYAKKASGRLAKGAWEYSGASEIDALDWVAKKAGTMTAAKKKAKGSAGVDADDAPAATLTPAAQPELAGPQRQMMGPHLPEMVGPPRPGQSQSELAKARSAARRSQKLAEDSAKSQSKIEENVEFIASRMKEQSVLSDKGKAKAGEGGGGGGILGSILGAAAPGMAGLLGKAGAGGLIGKAGGLLSKIPGVGGFAAGAAGGVATKGAGLLGKAGGALGKAGGKSLVKKIPLLGALAGLGFGAQRAFAGDWKGAGMEVASGAAGTFPGLGTAASLGIDGALAVRDMNAATDGGEKKTVFSPSPIRPAAKNGVDDTSLDLLTTLVTSMTDKSLGIYVKPSDTPFSEGGLAAAARPQVPQSSNPEVSRTPRERPTSPRRPAEAPVKPMELTTAPFTETSFAPKENRGTFMTTPGNYAKSPLADIIGQKESKNDYSAYNKTKGGLQAFYKTGLNEMSLGEVMEKQKNRDMFAAGRFQVIPSTLKEASEKLKLNPTEKFDEKMQDRIFNEYLVAQKRPEIKSFLDGKGSMESAQLATAKEWASMPVAAGTKIANGKIAAGGESYYAGDGLNAAHTSEDKVRTALAATKAGAVVASSPVHPLGTTQQAAASRELRTTQRKVEEAEAKPAAPLIIAQSGGSSAPAKRRGGSGGGDSKPPIVVRNNESSLTRVTDNMIAATIS